MTCVGIQLTIQEQKIIDDYQECIQEKVYDAQALLKSKEAIKLDVNDYSAWWLRRRCLEADANADLLREIEQVRIWIAESPKNYQSWYHRRWLMRRLPDPSEQLKDEIPDLNDILDEDSKNHNAWQYRQWMISHFQLPLEPEYEMIEDLIIADCHNNSAWNYREWLCGRAEPAHRAEVIKREVKYATMWLERSPNEAIINYLLGMFRDPASTSADRRPTLAEAHPKLKETLMNVSKGTKKNPLVIAALALLVWAEGDLQQALQLFKTAACSAPVTAGLYKWRIRTLERMMLQE